MRRWILEGQMMVRVVALALASGCGPSLGELAQEASALERQLEHLRRSERLILEKYDQEVEALTRAESRCASLAARGSSLEKRVRRARADLEAYRRVVEAGARIYSMREALDDLELEVSQCRAQVEEAKESNERYGKAALEGACDFTQP